MIKKRQTRKKGDKPPVGDSGEPVQEAPETGDDVERIVNGYIAKVSNPLSGIRAMCVHCMGGQVRSVTDCPSEFPVKKGQKAMPCPLWPFRMGKNTMDARYGVAKEFPNKKVTKKKAAKKRATKKRATKKRATKK
jgi:hypothetical protein